MKYDRLILVAAVLLLGRATGQETSPAADVQAPEGVLTWTNGDTLPGLLLDADKTHLRWQSRSFQAPFSLDLRYLAAIRFPGAKPTAAPSEPYRFVLHSGDFLYGDLIGIEENHFVGRSARHGGEFRLRTSALRGVQRLDAAALVFSGPVGLAGWKTISRGRSMAEWKSTDEGYLGTKGAGAELFREAQLPPIAEVEIGLRWTGKPGFLITFATPNRARFSTESAKLETWEDELVLQTLDTNGDFLKLKTLSDDTKQLQLRLYWDQNAGELGVYSQQGELLGRMTIPPKQVSPNTGLYLQSKGDDLTITHLRISAWSGAGPRDLQPGQYRIQLSDGETLFGKIQSLDKSSQRLTVTADNGPREVELDKVVGIYLTDVRSPAAAVPPARISFQDGELVRGELVSIRDGVAHVQTDYTDEPLAARLDQATSIVLHTNEKLATNGTHLMTYEGGKLRGQLAESGPEGKTLGWQPVGSSTASPLGPDCRARISGSAALQMEKEDKARTDVVYLRNGDVVPCHVEAIDEEHIYLAAPFLSATKIPQSLVKAVELGADLQQLPTGFDGAGWTVVERQEGTLERNNHQAVFHGPATLGHSTILRGDTLQFDVSWNQSSPSALHISLFTREANRGKQPQLLLYFAGPQVIVRGLQNGVQQVHNQAAAQRKREAKVKFVCVENRVDVFVDDNKVVSTTIPDAQRDGNGLVMAVQRLQQGDRTKKMLTLSNLQIGRSNSTLSSLRIDDDQKQIVLTVPRQRKRNPPTHVLVAPTGDLLRGRLVSLSADKVQFNSRLEDLAFDRNRLAGIIWLDPPPKEPEAGSGDPQPQVAAVTQETQSAGPDQPATQEANADREEPVATEPPDPTSDSMRVLLSNGAILSFNAQGVGDAKILGQSEVLGACGVPFAEVHELHLGHYVQVDAAYADWKLHPAKEPQFATAGPSGSGGSESPLVGTTAKGFSIPLLDEGRFELAQHSDKIIVLDFWATWCGPCIRAMPELIEIASEFPQDKVLLLAVNQEENEQAIREFMASRDWKVQVGLDRDGKIGDRFQVTAIPQTVILGPGLKIERVFVGSGGNTASEIRTALQKLVSDNP